MNDLEKALFACGQLSWMIRDFPLQPIWVRDRRRAAAVRLASADSDWEGSLEDLDLMVLHLQAGLPLPLSRIEPHTYAVAGYILLQSDAALASLQDLEAGGTGLPLGPPRHRGPEAGRWLETMDGVRRTLGRLQGPTTAFVDAVWRIGQRDLRRSCLMVAVSGALRSRWGLGPEAPGLWGALPQEAETRDEFRGRFARALAWQAADALAAALELQRRDAAAMRTIQGAFREGSRFHAAWRSLLARRIVSPALLAAELAVTLPGASHLLHRLVEVGLAVEIVRRGSYRRFAAADDTRTRAVFDNAPQRRRRKGSKADQDAGPFPVPSSMPDPSPTAVPEIDEDQLQIALVQLEAAMRSSDQAFASSDEALRQHRARLAGRPG